VTANRKRWAAKTNYDSKTHYLGNFITKQQAALAYDREARQCVKDKPLNYESIEAAEEAAEKAAEDAAEKAAEEAAEKAAGAVSWPTSTYQTRVRTERNDGGQGAEGTCPGVAKGLGACEMCAFGRGMLCEDCEY
jgi:hypothetical protein